MAEKKALASTELFKEAISNQNFDLNTKSTEGLTALLITLRGYMLSTSTENQDTYLKALTILLHRKNNYINEHDAENRTALYFLTVFTSYPEAFSTAKDRSINLQLIELFLQQGANPLIADTKDITAVHFAVEKQDLEILQLFAKYNWIMLIDQAQESDEVTEDAATKNTYIESADADSTKE